MDETPDDETSSLEDDFALLMEAVDDMSTPKVGELLQGNVISVDADGAVLGLGQKRDGFVPRADLDRANKDISPGDKIMAVLVSVKGRDGHLELSVYQARQNEDWLRAEALLESGELWVTKVNGYNRGGLIVPFGGLRGFVPASHIADLPRGISENDRHNRLIDMVDEELGLKVIEVDRLRRRLVLSQREAQREWRARRKAELLDSLEEGQVLKGQVSGLREFGAFIDLGGADGLVHVSELAWQRVEHPREVVQIGDEIDVMVIRVDVERNRIGLSRKRLQSDPWEGVEEQYVVGQELNGKVTRLAPFGAFVELGDGIEGLLHSSEIPEDLTHVVQLGVELRLRIGNVDANRQRIGLSLQGMSDSAMEEDGSEAESSDSDESALQSEKPDAVPEAGNEDAPQWEMYAEEDEESNEDDWEGR